jgi:hypothetical protein
VLHGRSKRTHKFVTRHYSVLITGARLQLALQNGLRASSISFDKKNNAVYVVKHSIEPQAVIAKATSNGASWSVRLPACAAAAGNLPLLIWLRSRGCPWNRRQVVLLAARSGSVAMLQHLRSALCSHCWSQDRIEKMFEEVGWWLLDNAAAVWPDSFTTETEPHRSVCTVTVMPEPFDFALAYRCVVLLILLDHVILLVYCDSRLQVKHDVASYDVASYLSWRDRSHSAHTLCSLTNHLHAISAQNCCRCWTPAAVEWALQHNSGWLHWDCEDFHMLHFNAQHRAAELFEWAHTHGCPCTCDDFSDSDSSYSNADSTADAEAVVVSADGAAMV